MSINPSKWQFSIFMVEERIAWKHPINLVATGCIGNSVRSNFMTLTTIKLCIFYDLFHSIPFYLAFLCITQINVSIYLLFRRSFFSSFVISEPMRVTNIREGTAPAAGEVSIITHTHTSMYVRIWRQFPKTSKWISGNLNPRFTIDLP